MGPFSFEHSPRGHRADIALYAVAVGLLAGGVCLWVPAGRSGAAGAWVAAGLAMWTLVEYLLHRFLLHRVAPFRGWHARHHRRPAALIATPTLWTATLFVLLVFAPALAALGLWRALALTLGMVGGYLAYTLVHHGVHHAGGRLPLLRPRTRWHARHHCAAAPPACFGVTSGLWDHVFGTADAAAPRGIDDPPPAAARP
jgi:cyclopropane-fatty-acyl-phospholipid synthase